MMAQFIYRKRAQSDSDYVEIIAADGDALTVEEALIVMLKDLDASIENVLFAIQARD